MAPIRRFDGTLQYLSDRAVLQTNGDRRVLVIDNPPTGFIDKGDIAAAHTYFRDVLGAQEGDSVRVTGIAGTMGPMSFLQVIRLS
ncbi:MAG: hypothetical protein ACRD2T_10795 [Thermoanaerobaculia bacterium]